MVETENFIEPKNKFLIENRIVSKINLDEKSYLGPKL